MKLTSSMIIMTTLAFGVNASMWDAMKEEADNGWKKTKEVSKEAENTQAGKTVKEYGSKAWEGTKEYSKKAYDKSKTIYQDATK